MVYIDSAGQTRVLVHRFVDFLRLPAIGDDDFSPQDLLASPRFTHAEEPFVAGVKDTHQVEIPATADCLIDTADKSFEE